MTAFKWVYILSAGLALSLPPVSMAQTQAQAQTQDISPTLLIETGPSDMADYRRMVFVKYLSNDAVRVAYKAYNRSEFIQIEDTTPESFISACVGGKTTTLEEIEAYQAAEAQARAEDRAPIIAHFCIKNIGAWEAGNRTSYLDPIFDGMPYAASLNN